MKLVCIICGKDLKDVPGIIGSKERGWMCPKFDWDGCRWREEQKAKKAERATA